MELKKGMYVRYTRGMVNGYVPPRIAKIVDCSDNDLVSISNKQVILQSDIIKASNNLIDLIEVGDLIETPKGIFQVGYIENNVIYTDNSKVIACLREDKHLCFENTTIVSIVTKEQFESQKYIVESE